MYYYYPTRQPVLIRNTELRVDRHLPVQGEVKVRIGDRVEASTVVAVGEQAYRPLRFNIARLLDVEPSKVSERLVKAPGDAVEAQETIAKRRRGLRSQTVKSPVAGTFVRFDPDTGVAVVRPQATHLEMLAYVAGIVEDLEQARGVTIRLLGSRFFGMFGVGEEAFGVLKVLGQDRQRPLSPDQLDSRAARAIVAVGGAVSATALQKAVQVGVKGVIAGSIEEVELLQFLKVSDTSFWRVGLPDWHLPVAAPLTLVLTEGFGRTPMAAPLYDTLVESAGESVSLCGITQLAGSLRRPEVLLSSPGSHPENELSLPIAALTPGTLVRVVDQDHLGLVATVAEAPRRRRLAGSLVLDALEVALPQGGRLTVPTANVEVLT
jgi:hypothetical protein